MSRQIKFRAWNHKHKYMDDAFFIRTCDGATFDVPKFRYDTPNTEIEYTDEFSPLMQFTGLLDKAGKEIFEGDLLQMDDLIVPVVFDDGSFQIKTNTYQGSSHLMQDRAKRFEVIGNIYQNPELLEEN